MNTLKNRPAASPKLHVRLFCIALILVLVGSIGASLVQSDFGHVRVKNLEIEVDDGYHISGLLLVPEKASPENPVPLVITCHGSYNNKEMQDQNFVELSRRGFAVLAMDAINHGSSSTNAPDGAVNFSMIPVVDYVYDHLNYIDRDKIGITGHSMGAMITSQAAQHFLTAEALGTQPPKIAAVLDVGYDPQYTPYEVEGLAEPLLPEVDWGVIQAKYDEWFFRSPDVNDNPALYLDSDNARTFINQVGANVVGPVENGKVYQGGINGETYKRVIYQSNEIHPQNHFSTASAGHMIDFFYETLGVPSGYEIVPAQQQVWQWKEALNLLALIGIFLMLYPLAVLLMRLPFFAELRADQPPKRLPALSTPRAKVSFWLAYAINLVLPALLLMPVAFYWIGKASFVPTTVTPWFGEPNTNELAGWSAVVGLALLAVFLLNYFLTGKSGGASPDSWGVKISLKKLWKSFLMALAIVTFAYLLLFFVNFCFGVDFRIWMIAMKPFTVNKLVYAVAYFPAFLLFYLVNSLCVNGGNRVEGMPDWLVTLISCISNIAGIAVLIFIQYSNIIGKGVFVFNSMRIVNLFPLLVLIPAATIITRRFFNKTGQIYVGSCTIAMLYTMMTCANTMFTASILP